MSNEQSLTVQEAIKVLTAAGAVFSVPTGNHLSVKSVAAKLDCSKVFVYEHLAEFPNAWKMGMGDLRIPVRDVEEFVKRGRLTPPKWLTVAESDFKYKRGVSNRTKGREV